MEGDIRKRRWWRIEKGGSWRTINADAIAQMGICEDLGAVGDCQ